MEDNNMNTQLGDREEQETVFNIPNNRPAESEREEAVSGIGMDEDTDVYRMFSALMGDHKRLLSKMTALEDLVTESVDLFRNGQTEMHRLITEAQSSRFASSNKKKRRENAKAYTPEDKKIFGLMAGVFEEGTSQDSKMFSQYCNMEVMKSYGYYPGAKTDKKNTGALDNISDDFMATGGEGVPSFSDYFQIAMGVLTSFNLEVPAEAIKHHAQMPGVDKSDSNSNISDDDTRGSNITDEAANEDENPY